MPKTSEQEILSFNKEFEKCTQNINNDELAIDGERLRKLVSKKKETAWDFVELYCLMAQGQPAFIMTAYIVAIAYEVEFEDNTLEKMVLERAKELNALEYILDIKTSL